MKGIYAQCSSASLFLLPLFPDLDKDLAETNGALVLDATRTRIFFLEFITIEDAI